MNQSSRTPEDLSELETMLDKRKNLFDTIKARMEKLFDSGYTYTLGEIGNRLFGKPRGFAQAFLIGVVDAFFVKQVLEDLIEEGVVEAREVETRYGTEVYYAKN